MSTQLSFEPDRAAVVSMDYQASIVSIYGGTQKDELLSRAAGVLEAARRAGILLEASDADYRLVVIKDCCMDLDPELHLCLVDKLFVRQAAVITAAEFREALGPKL